MVIKAIVALWKRPDIARICFKGIKRLQKTIDINPICIYSEDESKELCNEFGFENYYCENEPLGRKMNFGLDRALESNWDYLIQIDSDDLIKEELFDIYQTSMNNHRMAFGVGCIYFYDIHSGKQAKQSGMQVYGCGRMIHRDILDKENIKAKFRYSHTMAGPNISIKKGKIVTVPEYIADRMEKRGLGKIMELLKDDTPLWTDSKMSGLNYDSEFRLNTRGVNVDYIDIQNKPLCLDIKNGENLHDITEYDPIDFDVLNNFEESGDIRRLL